MVRQTWILGGIAALAASQAAIAATVREGSIPRVGEERTVPVGSPVYEKFRYSVIEGARPTQPIAKTILLVRYDVPAGLEMVRVGSASKFKACVEGLAPCALDDDGDGTFDRVARDDTTMAVKLKPAVPYERVELVAPDPRGDFRQTVTFLGAASDTLRLSYREFMNGTARPAFTEEFTFPLAKSFPQRIAFKEVRLTVLSIDGEGLRYRLEPF